MGADLCSTLGDDERGCFPEWALEVDPSRKGGPDSYDDNNDDQ